MIRIIPRLIFLFLMLYDIASFRLRRLNRFHRDIYKVYNSESGNTYWDAIEPIMYSEVGLKEKLSSYEQKYQDNVDNDQDNEKFKYTQRNITASSSSSAAAAPKTSTETSTNKINLPLFDVDSVGMQSLFS